MNTQERLKNGFLKSFLSHGMGGTLFEQLAEKHAAFAVNELGELTELTSRLHELGIHPDYEYESTQAAYKGGYEKLPEKGGGWESNVDRYRGVTRDEPVEYQHWRRLKSEALNDEVGLHDLQPIVLPRMSIAALMEILANKFDRNRMFEGRADSYISSKPEYIERANDLFQESRTDIYHYNPNYSFTPESRIGPYELRVYGGKPVINRYGYLMLALPDHPFRLIVDLAQPIHAPVVWIRCCNAQGGWGTWQPVDGTGTELPINQYALEGALENL